MARGDVLDPATLTQAMADCDAVVSSLGVTSSYRKPTTLYSAVNCNVRGGYSIARADLADACLTLLDDPAAMRATIGIGY